MCPCSHAPLVPIFLSLMQAVATDGVIPCSAGDCVSLRDAPSEGDRRLPVEAGTHQSYPMGQAEEAAGSGQAPLGRVGGLQNCVQIAPWQAASSRQSIAGSVPRSCLFPSMPSWVRLSFPKEVCVIAPILSTES